MVLFLQVDIFQMAVLELAERDGCPLFHVEHFIEGDYVKYNSNSGYVKENNEHIRLTPHAFSHFSFERYDGMNFLVYEKFVFLKV
jgi:elongation factor 2 kinase